MFRRIVVGGTGITAMAAVAVKSAGGDPKPASTTKPELEHYKCKPSDLPLYAPLHSLNKPKAVRHPPKDSATRQAIEGGIRAVRVEVQSGLNVVAKQKKSFDDIIATGKAHSQSTIDYLNEPSNTISRAGAITVGGLSGFILAIRGGFIKRLVYTSVCAGGIASICYPTEAAHYAKTTLVETKKVFAIAYNFVHGIKPGDEVPVDHISKFPTSVDELTDMFADMYDSAKDALFSSKK